jgi:predicted GTPase
MSALVRTSKGTRSLDRLIAVRPEFSYLAGKAPIASTASRWINGYEIEHNIQIIVLGKSGVGKSSFLNALIGEKLFETSDVVACTRVMQSVDYEIPFVCWEGGRRVNHYVSFADLPGIGEDARRDDEYFEMYGKAINHANAVIYLVRSDQRDYTSDIEFVLRTFEAGRRTKFFVAISAIDKISPINRSSPFVMSEEQSKNLFFKINQISKLFELPKKNIIPISASEGFGLNDIGNVLQTTLEEHLLPISSFTKMR